MLEVHWKGGRLHGSIEILQTPSGLLLWELYSQGIRLGVSSRGWASLRTCPNSDAMYVDEDFELITFDFVTEPSTADAFLFPIQKSFRGTSRVPSQAKAVQIAHLGHGVCSMDNIGRLPGAQVLAARISRLQAQEVGGVAVRRSLWVEGTGALPLLY